MTEKQGQFKVVRYKGGPWHGGRETYANEFHTFCSLWFELLWPGIEVGQGEVTCRRCLKTARYKAMR